MQYEIPFREIEYGLGRCFVRESDLRFQISSDFRSSENVLEHIQECLSVAYVIVSVSSVIFYVVHFVTVAGSVFPVCSFCDKDFFGCAFSMVVTGIGEIQQNVVPVSVHEILEDIAFRQPENGLGGIDGLADALVGLYRNIVCRGFYMLEISAVRKYGSEGHLGILSGEDDYPENIPVVCR